MRGRQLAPRHLAIALAVTGVVFWVYGLIVPTAREVSLVVGLFFVLLAGGVLNWDRRGGH